MNLFTVDLKNQPGEFAHLCELIAGRGVNLELAATTAGDRGTVVFIADDEASARAVCEAAGIAFSERPALKVRCADQPGEYGRLARNLATANVNIEAVLPIEICQGQVVCVISVDDVEAAQQALADQLVD